MNTGQLGDIAGASGVNGILEWSQDASLALKSCFDAYRHWMLDVRSSRLDYLRGPVHDGAEVGGTQWNFEALETSQRNAIKNAAADYIDCIHPRGIVRPTKRRIDLIAR